MPVKANQPTLRADIQRLFERAAGAVEAGAVEAADRLAKQRVRVVGDRARGLRIATAESCAVGHGRIERRRLQAIQVPAAVAWLDWPGRTQVFALRREVRFKKSGRQRSETVYGITSLGPAAADAATLLAIVRQHWQIENGLHWVRDVTFDEDRSQVRSGHLPQVLASVRNTALGLLRRSGATNIAAACRACAAQPWQALSLLGIQRTE